MMWQKLGRCWQLWDEKHVKDWIALSSPEWSRPRCPELVAGSREHVVVVVMESVYGTWESTYIGHMVVVGITLSHPPSKMATSSSPQKRKKKKKHKGKGEKWWKMNSKKMSRVWWTKKQWKSTKTVEPKMKARDQIWIRKTQARSIPPPPFRNNVLVVDESNLGPWGLSWGPISEGLDPNQALRVRE
jgi:hypothetical protein